MAYRAIRIQEDPINYFLKPSADDPFLQTSDVILRVNNSPKEVFSRLIRLATNSKWSHSAIVYLTHDPKQGFNNTFLIEAMTKGIHITSWRNEVVPLEQFTVGIKRPPMDWYVESPQEQARHNPADPKDTHAISYLRHVRGIAIDQISGLYDHKTVYELAALYSARAARQHLGSLPIIADAADKVADLLKKWDASSDNSSNSMMNFICSGLVQYSFFEALRRRIINDLAIPENRDAALSNLSNIQRIIFREDPDGIISSYIHDLQTGKLDIHQDTPENVLDLLKTATPADFNNSSNLAWRYVVLNGAVWSLEKTAAGYVPASQEEEAVLSMLHPEHRSSH